MDIITFRCTMDALLGTVDDLYEYSTYDVSDENHKQSLREACLTFKEEFCLNDSDEYYDGDFEDVCVILFNYTIPPLINKDAYPKNYIMSKETLLNELESFFLERCSVVMLV